MPRRSVSLTLFDAKKDFGRCPFQRIPKAIRNSLLKILRREEYPLDDCRWFIGRYCVNASKPELLGGEPTFEVSDRDSARAAEWM